MSKVNIKKINLRFKNRAVMAFERLTGKPFELKTNTDLLVYYYAVVISSNPDMELSFDEFIDATDEDETLLTHIGTAFANSVKNRIDNTPKEADKKGKK